jgi:excisionase family DNA binding protein
MYMEIVKSPAESDVCTTQEAAKLLGISVTSVQHLVEAGEIEAWKTKGGHRRIPISAVRAYKEAPGAGGYEARAAGVAGGKTTIHIIEDNEMQRELYRKQISGWGLDIDLSLSDNGYHALVEIARRKPDVVLADIVMDGIDGYEVINTILGYPDLVEINIAILSALKQADLEARGGIPKGVVFFSKPINYDELRGYLRACCAQKARKA